MCGIAGIVDLSNGLINEKTVKEMSQAMVNRGPDTHGIKKLNNAILAHRRLSVLDLSHYGNQPMHDKNKNLFIVFNGEIYNHLSIKNTLQNKGYIYYSKSDTESILYGFDSYGSDITSMMRGMWAFAIWNKQTSTLFLSRDRFGEKPLYYFHDGNRLAFASSLSGLEPALKTKEINPNAVIDLLAYEYIPTKHSIYKNVNKLPPGSNLIFSNKGLFIEQYWNLDYRNKITIGEDEAINQLDRLINESVKEQLIADVPVGVFLSGGVDSGYISASASRYKNDLSAITMTVPNSLDRDESVNARIIAKKHNINMIEVPLNENCIKRLPNLLMHMEPFGDSSLIPLSAVSAKASELIKVVLTGDGGDEGFGGYGQPFLGYNAQNMNRNRYNKPFLKTIAPLLRFLSKQRINPLFRYFRLQSSKSMLAASSGISSFLNSKNAMTSDVSKLLFGPLLKNAQNELNLNHTTEFYLNGNYNNWWDALFDIGIKTRLVDDFLYKVDSASMYHSLETRSPFLDHRIISFAASLPQEIIIPNTTDKYLVKKAASLYNPKSIVYAPKKGFSIPVEKYFLYGWKILLEQLIKNGLCAQLGILEPKGVIQYLNKHGSRHSQRLDRQLFTILSLEIWLQVFHQKNIDPDELGEKLLHYSKK